MRAMVYRGPYKIRVEEKDIPALEHPDDAIVQVRLAAICGSDLHPYHGMMHDTRVGMTFGHEFLSVVHEVGPSVQRLKPGDRVMVPFNIYCGSCYFCVRLLKLSQCQSHRDRGRKLKMPYTSLKPPSPTPPTNCELGYRAGELISTPRIGRQCRRSGSTPSATVPIGTSPSDNRKSGHVSAPSSTSS
jgi:Alcohol dehydrogenase GroES-like domain